jgi:hypothetical protein
MESIIFTILHTYLAAQYDKEMVPVVKTKTADLPDKNNRPILLATTYLKCQQLAIMTINLVCVV